MRYFFNAKFDGHFIIDALLKMGFVHVETDRDGLATGQFTTLISDMNKFYSAKIKWHNGHVTEIWDAAKKFPNMSVSTVAKAFQLEESKGVIDYEKTRPVGYQPTEDEIEYLLHDCVIVARALKMTRDNGMKKLTIGSDSLYEFKSLMGGDKMFRHRFPILSDEMDMEIRRAYRGGFTYADPRFQGSMQGAGLVLDVNSLYPSVMYTGVIPYGMPEFVDGEVPATDSRPCTIFSVTFTAKLKPNHIPCIQIKGSVIFGSTEYLTEINDPVTLMVSNVDWDLWNDHYDIFVMSFNGGWRFRGTVGLFADYIDKWSHIKVTSKGGQREIAKLHLNTLYGKLASNPNVTGKVPVLDDNGVVRFKRGRDARKAPVYTAAGVFITSLARDLTIRAAQLNYDVFAYADTDSLHLMTSTIPDNIEVDPHRMGAWKHEYDFERAYYVRSKAYMEQLYDGSYHTAWAGLKSYQTAQMTFDDLVDGKVIEGKLQPFAVPGGVVLKKVPYKLNLQKL